MANLLVSAAVNIGAGLLLNFLFPQRGPDVTQEGPRLQDLSVTSAAYGRDIPYGYGTIRQGGNIIWSPGIEEVAETQTQEAGGKGGAGGGSVSTTTFTYFASFAIAFGEGVAQDVLRIWADGKLIFDKTGTGLSTSKNLEFRFYPGNETQLPDPLIEAAEGAGNVPAHRGLTYLVAERWPLADFGNRIPQITAEIAYKADPTLPFEQLNELSGVDVPGSGIGADATSFMTLDPFSDALYMFKDGGNGTTLTRIGQLNMTAVANVGPLTGSQRGSSFSMNGKVYVQNGNSNYEPFFELDGNTLEQTGFVLGNSNPIDGGADFLFRNGSKIGVLQVGAVELGVDPVDIFIISGPGSGESEGLSLVYLDETNTFIEDRRTSIGASRRAKFIMQDLHNRRAFVTMENDSVVELYEVAAQLSIGTFGPFVSLPEVNLIATYNKGGAQYAGTADTTGWCFVPNEEALILSNASSMFKVDLNTGSVLATNLSLGFRSQAQWTTTNLFAFSNGAEGVIANGFITTIDVDDLQTIRTEDLSLAGFSDGNEANYERGAYDPRSHSIIISRLNGINPSQRIVRLLLNRGNRDGEALSDVVSDLCVRAGLQTSDLDVSDLVALEVRGYSVNRQGAIRAALDPLQRSFLFEGVESDWLLKFVRRGGSPVLTVPENDIGRLTGSAEDEFIREVRQQEVELPAVFEVLYSDLNNDYQQGRQADRRVSNPTPTQSAENAISLDLPVVLTGTEGKQLAQRWLYTSWAERLSLRSTLPWRYLRLDPTDVFNIQYRGELRRLRLSQLEMGAGLDLDFSATQEDARSDVSDVPSDSGQGLLPQNVPSGLPSRLHLLDLPLLRSEDASAQQFSRAYWAASGYDNSWRGALLYQSRDDGASFQELGVVTGEAAWGLVQGTLPDPGTTFTWDESVTVNIKVARGIDRFQSASDLEVLNGANAVAIIRADGLPEIIQFATATQIDAGTIQLSRLLRGRRGTETLSTGHTANEVAVLLEAGRLSSIRLDLAQRNVTTQFRGVTLDTLIEDAVTENFAYSGQDLVPYNVVQVAGSLNASSTVDITFKRRTRYDGELRDGTGEVPVNEQGGENYEIDIRAVVDGEILSTVTGTSETITYDPADDFGLPVQFLGPFDVDEDDRSDNFLDGTLGTATVVQSTTVKFGAGALEQTPVNNTTQCGVEYSDLEGLEIGAGAFTLEAWVRFKSNPGYQQLIMSKHTLAGNQRGWYWGPNLTNNNFIWVVDTTGTGSFQVFNPGTFNFSLNTWYHVALSREEDGTTRLFVDGQQVGNASNFPHAPFNNTAPFRIGRFEDSGGDRRPLDGFIDDARVVIGRAVYTSNFTPPAAPFIGGGASSPAFVAPLDSDGRNVSNEGASSGTVGSNVSIQTTEARFGGSAEFSPVSGSDANSQITWPDSSTFSLGSGPFAIEFFVRFKDLTSPYNAPTLLQHYNPNANDRGWFIFYDGTNLQFTLYQSPGGGADVALTISGAFAFSEDVWYHVAATRDAGGTVRLFANGTQVASGTYAGAVHDPAVVLGAGFNLTGGGAAANLVNGFMDDIIITVGTAKYVANFTPPISAFSFTGGLPGSIVAEVFQMSNVVGRGRGSGQVTITL